MSRIYMHTCICILKGPILLCTCYTICIQISCCTICIQKLQISFAKEPYKRDNILYTYRYHVIQYVYRPRMKKSHSKRHELVDCPLFTIAR